MAITGDMHGEFERIRECSLVCDKNLAKNDYLFICGDFGLVWNNSFMEKRQRRYLASKKYTVCFIDGNHENFNMLNDYPVEMWNDGKVHIIERDKDNKPKVIHLMRGQLYTIGGKKIFSFGGAFSIDREKRIKDLSWWEQEIPTEIEMIEGLSNLERHNFQCDYIITHTLPEEIMKNFYKINDEERKFNKFLDIIKKNVNYKHFWCGHLHLDLDLDDHTSIMYKDVKNMSTNESLRINQKVGLLY